MRILFYYPSNKRTISLESVMIGLKDKGHQVHLLTVCQEGALHAHLKENGITAGSAVVSRGNKMSYFIGHIRYLVAYCRTHQIHFVFSHLQQANIIAVFAQYFTKVKFVIFRHHFKFIQHIRDEYLKVNRNEYIADKIINRLSKKIVVPSRGVYEGMVTYENVDKEKLSIIPYTYVFSNYHAVSDERVQAIRSKYQASLLIIMCARLTPFKRHRVAFKVFNALIKQEFDIKVMVMDEGEEKESLMKYVADHALKDRIYFLGYQNNILEYLAAADLLIHPSVTEASNSIVKESALAGTPVVVCKGVGDFDDYIVNGQNSFSISIEHTAEELEEVIKTVYTHRELLDRYAHILKADVISRFGEKDDTVLSQYERLMD